MMLRLAVEILFLPILPLDMPVHVCHCNGIVCAAAHNAGRVLRNPANKELRTLPKPPICIGHKDSVMAGVGFGYDSRANGF